MSTSGDVVGCIACDLTHDRRPLPGGRILVAGRWVVEHCVGPFGLGALIVKPARHVVHMAELTAEESAELGPLLQRTSAAITEVVRPEQVYVCLWSHQDARPGHLHFVVQPAMRADMDRFDAYGPRLQMAMLAAGETPPADDVARVCDRLRAELARN
jgi:diadenosine tetraphosphate (Ap4A) HIT family hydrolase